MAVFLLIGKTSALTMNVAGVVKDWMLIGISVWVFHSQVSALNLSGYLLAFSAVCWYNYQKITAAKLQAQTSTTPIKLENGEKEGAHSEMDVEQIPLIRIKGDDSS